MDERIKQKSLAEHIVDDLEQKIVAGSLKPGQRLIEQTLCETFGVSRAPVREALQILEARGFVVREPRKGVSVAKVSPQEAADIYRIRASLEGLATSLAVENRTPEFLRKLKELHERMLQTADKKQAAKYEELNATFHDLIITASGNPRLIQLINAFNKQTMRYRLAITSARGWMVNSLRVHASIVASFEAGDAAAAERARKDAILGQIEQFQALFKDEETT